MRITEISVEKLFGVFDYTIPLNLDHRITIMYGANGAGKTIILKMLYGLFNKEFSVLRTVPFQEFRVKFRDDSALWLDREDSESKIEQETLFSESDPAKMQRWAGPRGSGIIVKYSQTGRGRPLTFPLDALHAYTRRLPRVPSLELLRRYGYIRLSSRRWRYIPTDEILSTSEMLERLSHPEPSEIPDWWTETQKSISIHLIQTQRLRSIRGDVGEPDVYESTSRERDAAKLAVEEYAEELRDTIQQTLAHSASLSQSLDSTFPARLVQRMGNSERARLTNEQLRTKLSELDKKRSRLIDIGLLDKGKVVALPSRGINRNTNDVLALYAEDVEEKLGVFDDLANKVDLFKGMIDKRGFPYKQIVTSNETGFRFVTHDGSVLPLTALSSGEQQELVLLYQLLFKAEPDSLVLIDEPEISLNVAWQREFLQDLQEIVRLTSFDVLIATHSPQIIHDRRDLMVGLLDSAMQ